MPSSFRTPTLTFALAVGFLALVPTACGKVSPFSGAGSASSAGRSSTNVTSFQEPTLASGGPRKPERLPKAGEQISVPAGVVQAGSVPGDDDRDPMTEPAMAAVELGPFSIDRLPYPNDPNQPPRTHVSREEARSICQEHQARLCTELEWERACKGPENQSFSAGNAWYSSCATEPKTCASGFGVLAMGGAIREWTASDAGFPEKQERPVPVVRGASDSAGPNDHRCAHRSPGDATGKSAELGFRCCRGAPNAASVPPLRTPETTFSRFALDIASLAAVLATSETLAPFAKDLGFYAEPEAIETVLKRGNIAANKPGPVLTTGPILWMPAPNEEIVVVALRAKAAALIVALYRLPENRYRLASSLVLKEESGPVVLSFSTFHRKRVLWSTCWECPGEEGSIDYRDGRRVVVIQK